MVGGWRSSTWGQEIALEYGKALRNYDTAIGTYRVYGSNGPIGRTNTPLANGPGIILGRKGAYRGVQFSRDPFFVIDTAYYVVPKNECDMRWLYYAIQHHKLGEIDDGSPIPSTTRAAVYVRELDIPPLNEQRAIARILGTLDDKIELNRQLNATLEAMARALFKSWFVDFDPVRAKAEGRETGLPKPVDDLFPDSLDDTELGEVPKDWQVLPFAATVEIINGGTPKTSVDAYWNGTIPWFSVVDAPNETDIWAVDTERKITNEGVHNSATNVLPVGVTIISARGTVGKVALVGVPMAMNQSCYGLCSRTPALGYYTYFLTRELVTRLQQHAHGSVFDTITRDTLGRVSVPLPPDALIEAFEVKVGPILERVRTALLDSRTLAALRDTLLPKLLTGELCFQSLRSNLKTVVIGYD